MRIDPAPDDHELAPWLDAAQAATFVRHLGVPFEQPDLPTLKALVSAYLGRLPFQNLGMLVRPRRPPTVDEIRDDLWRGRGGPCNVLNPFLAALLARLGYEAWLVSGDMQQPDCHIALCVRIGGALHWLDAGNGHPYLEPVALGDTAPRQHAGLTWRLAVRSPGTYAVEHLLPDGTAWRPSYVFSPTPRPLSFFTRMIERHHTEEGYGPFLTGLRIIRFPGGELQALRDNVLLTGRTTVTRRILADRHSLLEATEAFFGDLDLPIAQALAALERAGHPLFTPPALTSPRDP